MQINKINNILRLNQNINQNNVNDNKQALNENTNKSDSLDLSKDASKLKVIAEKSDQLLASIESVRKDELKEIKKKLDNNYYDSPEVLDKIASSILNDDEFTQVLEKDEKQETVKNYVNSREQQLQKLDNTKVNILQNGYLKNDVYQQVADEVIDIYT